MLSLRVCTDVIRRSLCQEPCHIVRYCVYVYIHVCIYIYILAAKEWANMCDPGEQCGLSQSIVIHLYRVALLHV